MIPILHMEKKWRKEELTNVCPGYFVHPDRRLYPIYAYDILIGKAKGADLRTRYVGLGKREQKSRLRGTDFYHAYVTKAGGQFMVENVSKNHELILKRGEEEFRLENGEKRKMEDGDILLLGGYPLEFKRGVI